MRLELDTKLTVNRGLWEAPNLTDRFTDADLAKIGMAVWQGYDRDRLSRFGWEKRVESAMDLALQVQREKNFPWPKCANVVFPLVTIAALQFSARSYGNIIQGSDVVRYRVVGGDPTGDVRARADRISRHMSWQLLEEDSSWEEQMDRLLINLAIVGTTFKKTYYNPSLRHNTSEMIHARDFVLDYYAKNVESCARKTHTFSLYRNDIYERVQQGTFLNILDDPWYNTTPPAHPLSTQAQFRAGTYQPQADEDTPFKVLEQHRLLDLDQDGYAEPYIVTIEESSRRVLRIVARFDREEDVERSAGGRIARIRPMEYFTKYSFIPAPDGGIYDVGFGTLLQPVNESVNSAINQLLDAGTMATSAGGFLGRGAKIRGGAVSMAPWEWKRVDSTGDDLRKNLFPLPVREPSAVLFNLLNLLITYTDRVSGTTDIMVGANPGQNTTAEASRNMVEQGMQVYSMIFKRVWRSMKEEFKKIHRLNGMFLPTITPFGSGDDQIRREDYKSDPELIVPVADPNVTSQTLRLQQAQMLREAAATMAGYDREAVERNFLKALRVDGIDSIYLGVQKTGPLPNPKVQIEEARGQIKKMQVTADLQKFVLEQQAQADKVRAEIAKLEAETIKTLKDAGIADAEMKLRRFDAVIKAMKAQSDSFNNSLKTMKELTDGSADQGDVRGMAPAPGNAGVQGAPPPMAGGDQGAMGAGSLPGAGGQP